MNVKSLEAAFGNLMRSTISGPANLVTETDRFHMVRTKTLALLRDLTVEQGQWPPRDGKWSVAQIADHLLRSDEAIQEQFRRLISMAKAGDFSAVRIGLREADASMAGIPREVMQMFETPARIFSMFVPNTLRETMIRHELLPALNPKGSDPRPGMTVEKVRDGLATTLVEIETILRAPMPANLDKPTIDHPLLGNNNLIQLLRIMVAHEERHQRQISDIRAMAAFPKI